MKRGLVAGFLFALVVGLAWWSNGSNTTYTVQEALNRLIGAKPTEYTTQGALNVILTKPAERDTLVTLFTWIFDDGTDSLWTEYSAWVDSFAAYNQVGTISIMPYKCLHDDTTGTWLSKSDVLALEARGWDIEGHGYNGDDNLWAATGTYDMAEGINSKADYVRDMNRCMAGFDTLGLRTPRGFSWPTSGAHQIAIEAAQQAGFDYGFTNSVTATNGIRYNFRTEIDRLTGYRYVSAYPGVLPNRWEIGQCIGDANNFSTFRSYIKRGLKLRGSWIIYIGHSPQAWETTTGHGFEEALSYVDSLRDLGLLRVVTARVGYELMFETPIAASANYIYPNLPDMDADNQPDFVLGGRDSLEIGLGANTFTSAGTRDSVFVSADRTDHGVMGCGYVMTAGNGVYQLTDLVGSTSAASGSLKWFYSRDFQFNFINAWPGKEIAFEFWAQIDTTRQHALPSTADSIGITFEAWDEAVWGSYGLSAEAVGIVRNTINVAEPATPYHFVASYKYNTTAASSTPAYSVFGATDIVGVHWKHVQGTWIVPEWAKYVYINIVQDSSLKNKAVRLSNFSLTAHDRTNGQTW